MNFKKFYFLEEDDSPIDKVNGGLQSDTVDPFQVFIDLNLDGEMDDILDVDDDNFMDEIEDDDVELSSEKDDHEFDPFCVGCCQGAMLPHDDMEDVIKESQTLAPRMKRKLARAKREALGIATEGQFHKWKLKERAVFISKWVFKELPSFKGRFIKRSPTISISEVFKKMKRAAKNMRRNKKIRSRALQIKRITKGER